MALSHCVDGSYQIESRVFLSEPIKSLAEQQENDAKQGLLPGTTFLMNRKLVCTDERQQKLLQEGIDALLYCRDSKVICGSEHKPTFDPAEEWIVSAGGAASDNKMVPPKTAVMSEPMVGRAHQKNNDGKQGFGEAITYLKDRFKASTNPKEKAETLWRIQSLQLCAKLTGRQE